jgi:hypothetical protein
MSLARKFSRPRRCRRSASRPEQGEATTQIPGTQYDSGRHRILAPPIHDLDPYVPIGMKLGTFLLFTEAEIGTILTDNVLDTDFNEHKDIAFEFAPEVRLESNWARNFFMAQFTADRSWYQDFSVEDDKIYQALLRGRLDVTSRTHLELETEKSQTQVDATPSASPTSPGHRPICKSSTSPLRPIIPSTA